MKIVGLNIDKGRMAASVVVKGMRSTELQESFSVPFATDAELADILRGKAASWAGSRIVSSIPGRYFSQRLVKLPFSDRKRIEKALPFEIEDSVPFPLDDVILDHIVLSNPVPGRESGQETAVLAVMLPKAILRQHLDLLASAGVDPQAIVPSYQGLHRVSQMMAMEGPSILIDGPDLCFRNRGAVIACRSLSGAGFRHTLSSLENESGERAERAYVLSITDDVRAELAELGIASEQVAPEFGGRKPGDPASLGLALSDQMNFRKGEFSYRLADTGERKRRRVLIVAGAVAALLAAMNIGVKAYLVQSSFGKLDREIRQIYKQVFPEATAVADPVRQLSAKLDEAKKKFGALGSGTSALDVMKAVTEGIPKEVRVSFQDFNLEGDRLKLQGEASSFESVDKIKAELQKAQPFSEVAVLDTRMGVENKVKFRFEIKLKQTL